jgi:hypothetical protein
MQRIALVTLLVVGSSIASFELGRRHGIASAAAGGAASAVPPGAGTPPADPSAPPSPVASAASGPSASSTPGAPAATPMALSSAGGPALAASAAPPSGAPPSAQPGAPEPAPAAAPPGGATPPPPLASKARVRFDTVQHDFGAVPHGALVRRTFRYTNAGTDALEVLDVRTSCGCTAAEPTKRRLAPGESGEIAVSFDTGKKGAGRGRQRWTNTVTFRTNDPTARDGGPGAVRLTLVGDVIARYQIVPHDGLAFRAGREGGAAAMTASAEVLPSAEAAAGETPTPPLVAGPGGARVLETPPGVELVALRAIERDGRRGLAIDCAVRADAPVGIIDGAVRLETGNPAQPEVIVPVRGMIQAPVQAIPPRLFLGREQTAATRTIRVVGARAVEVLEARVVPGDGLPAPLVAEALAGGNVAVRNVPGVSVGAAGDILIFLADPKNPLLRVPYLIRETGAQRAESETQLAAGVRISPSELLLGEVDPARATESVVAVTRAGKEPVEIADLRIEPPGALEARLEKIAGGQVNRILVRPRADAPGPLAARVLFSPRPGAPSLAVRVAGRVLSRVAVAPEALSLLRGGPAEVVLRRRDGRPLRVLEAKDPAGRLTLRADALPEGAVRVSATVKGGPGRPTPGGHRIGEILLRTDVVGEEEIRVPTITPAAP